MTYSEAVGYIENIPRFTKKTDLAHTGELLRELGSPEQGMKIIHVAGTNGKGSTCAFIESMLRAGGYSTGLFTSPHLVRINERFMINGIPVSDEVFLGAFEKVMDAVERAKTRGIIHPTYFETLFLMGMLIFREAKVDYVVLETGMGGRLDATNVIEKPLACVITSISLDHTQYLGDTIPEIAGEKAGIIKPGIPVFYDGKNEEAAAVIAAKAEEKHSPAIRITPENIRFIERSSEGIVFDLTPGNSDFRNEKGGRGAENDTWRLRIPQQAEYQMMNASLAFAVMHGLVHIHGISDDILIEGIRRMRWPGRMQTVMKDVIIDGAHNVDGIAEFVRTVNDIRGGRSVTLLFGSVSDKRYPEMIRELATGIRPDHVVTTRISGSREEPEDVFAELFRKNGVSSVISDPSPEKAFHKALALKGNGLLFCVGSLYLAGELLSELE